MRKLRVGILGATGAAGLEFVRALARHPWFRVAGLHASDKNVGKTLEEAAEMRVYDPVTRNMLIKAIDEVHGYDLVCSALPSSVARDIEARCAKQMPVISTTSAFRYEPDVPILITEVNADHYRLLMRQKERGWHYWIAPGPNCTTVGLVMSLAPLSRAVGLERVVMSSYQSMSGGGYGLVKEWERQHKAGFPSPMRGILEPMKQTPLFLDGNVIGHIEKEEEKVRTETGKILGASDGKCIEHALFPIDCSCVRVPTVYGHFETVFVETSKRCSVENVKEIYGEFNASCKTAYGHLPSSPAQTVFVLDRSPQPYFDVNVADGMSIVVGRIEKSPLSPKAIKYQVLSNNVLKGAAKGMIQVAEYLYSVGFLHR
ncbi:aspartate-semialdehyde dehydrogenase [Candidatus Woesearchaeota archaeon]|nr:aspartate-semialdehyde dehydrogenase [Candidatus Woesearchaeota archaeon]